MATADTIQTHNPLEILNRAFLLDFPKDAARRIETMTAAEAIESIGDQPVHILERLWFNLAPGVADALLKELPDKTAAELLMALDAGPAATLISRLDEKKQETLFSLMESSVAWELKEMLSYPENAAGRLMDTHIIAFNENISVEDALNQLRNQQIEALHHLYLLDDDMRLHGQVDIQRLALADGRQKLVSLSLPVRAFVQALDPKDEVVDKVKKMNLDTIPVIDANSHLLGIIHGSSLMDTLQEDIASDMQTMVGVSKDERALSSAWFAVKKRQPWLQINLVTAFMAAAVVGMFEDTIAKYTALAILLPIAAGQSGNTGAQALAVTMRGLTLREITIRHWLRVTMKEAGAAVINGFAIAITCGLGVFLWSSSYGLALIIALAMISSMTLAAIAGALVPIILKRMGQDPALSSTIILTTVTDIAGFMSFLGIAATLSWMLDAGM